MQGNSDQNLELLDAGGLVGHLVPAGSVYGFLAEHRRRLFPDDMFTDLFPSSRGRPSVPGDVIATVMVLQSLEGLSDRDAVDSFRTDLKWKVACGVSLGDEGFHPTVLTLWRNRLRGSDAPERIFDAVRQVVTDTGVLTSRTRRALDSTLLDDAVATQDTVTQLTSVIRRVRKTLPQAAAVSVSAHDYDAGGKPVCAWDDPVARDELVSGLVNDAIAILDAIEGTVVDDDEARLVGLLALVAGQDVEPGDEEGTWRIFDGTVKDRVISTVDPETRHMHKSRSSYRDGYKAHIAVEPETGIITACALTPANVGDGPVGVELLENEVSGLQVLGDSGYGSGPVRADLADADHTVVIKPIPLGRNWRLGDNQYTRDDFTIDYRARTVTCPNQVTASINDAGRADFRRHCNSCEKRSRCTAASRGRIFTVGDYDQLLAKARTQWRQGDDIADYRKYRPMVERSIAWLVANGHRRVRYRGADRNRIALSTRAAVLNLRRLVNLGLTHNPNGWVLPA
jgi:IS5 family transposase